MWTDKVKALTLLLAVVLAGLLVLDQHCSRVTSEELAVTIAAKQKAEERSKKYEADNKAGLAKAAKLEAEKKEIAGKYKTLEKELLNVGEFSAKMPDSLNTDIVNQLIAEYAKLWEAKKACDELNANAELRLEAMTDLYKTADANYRSSDELLQKQLQISQECQENATDEGQGIFIGGGYGINGWTVGVFYGKRVLKLELF